MSSENPGTSTPTAKSFLDNDIHSHISGVSLARPTNPNDTLAAAIERRGLLGTEAFRESAAKVVKLLRTGGLQGKVALVTGVASSGKSAMSVAIARELQRPTNGLYPLFPAVGMEIGEVFQSGSNGMKWSIEPTNAFKENLLRVIGVETKECKFISLYEHLNSSAMVSTGSFAGENDGGIGFGRFEPFLNELNDQYGFLRAGVLFIRGLNVEVHNEAHYVAFLSNLQAVLAACFNSEPFQSLVPAVIVLAHYSIQSPIGFILNEKGMRVPKGINSQLVQFSFETSPFNEMEIEEIFQMRAVVDKITIGVPVLMKLKKMAKKNRRNLAHRLLHEAVQLAKKKAAENGPLEKQLTITKAHFNIVVGEMSDPVMALEIFFY